MFSKDKTTHSLLPIAHFQLLLHSSYQVFQFFRGEVFTHAVHLDGETKWCESLGKAEHDARMLDALEHVAEAEFFHLLVEDFLESLPNQYIVGFIFIKHIEKKTR